MTAPNTGRELMILCSFMSQAAVSDVMIRHAQLPRAREWSLISAKNSSAADLLPAVDLMAGSPPVVGVVRAEARMLHAA